MLLPFLPFDPNETPLSYAARLAHYHADKPIVPFLRDLQIRPEAIASSEPDALARLAETSGAPLNDLRRNAAVRQGKRTYDLRGEPVTAEFLSNPYTVFCPACLAEDDMTGRRRGRWHWALSIVRTCPHHEIALVRQAQAAWDDKLHELDRRVPERGSELQAMIERAVRRSVSPLQGYVQRRLEGIAGPDWLDAQTLDQATRATELLGVLVVYGRTQKLPELTSDDWDHAGRVGFQFTSRGEEGIREALETQLRKFDEATGNAGPRKIFGCFYNALAHSKSLKEPGDIARILRDVITENIVMPAGTKVLGVEFPERQLHTVASLAKEQSLDSRTLSNVLVAAGAIPENAPAHFAIPADLGREIAGRMKRTVNVISLWKDMNCTRPLVDQLFADRLLTPIYYGRPSARGRAQKAVDRDEIAVLVGKLHAKAAELDAETDGLVPVSKAAEKAKVPAVAVVHMILGGFLGRVFRLAGQGGIGALRVDSTEVERHAAAFGVGLSPMAAFGALKIPRDVGWRLVDRHPQEVSLTVDWIAGSDDSHRIPRFDPADVGDFKARFTHPARIAETHGLQVGEVVGRLKRRGIRPILTRAKIGVDFYRTNDLEPDLFT
ncbi:TniQ family protein [Paracoccus seriniphilus]|uniref:TniQ protein n=1 Tax=Paracoccus seriniphilus TaxID=184748 RepID=A0A239Q2S9_9RHOB|nr:TniQ family protein [Paracoccus seriniphilus]WCR16271.1 TniQ family protein [Paracoccus seriniphilus]SNT76814.1 TniQ protein [Paracoccus seriniphilus]